MATHTEQWAKIIAEYELEHGPGSFTELMKVFAEGGRVLKPFVEKCRMFEQQKGNNQQ
jgi:hypothetical protein